LWFEDVNRPSIRDLFGNQRLRDLLLKNYDLAKIKLVIISADHSSQLAEIFIEAGIPSVVCVDAAS
jgi:hypothetical protein